MNVGGEAIVAKMRQWVVGFFFFFSFSSYIHLYYHPETLTYLTCHCTLNEARTDTSESLLL